ncbi:MAG: MoxR family ATPase [Planctomycetota bacterium]|nr:MoxR family ATPase [Planctomycetota bacterium]
MPTEETTAAPVAQQAAEFREVFQQLQTEIGKVMVGHREIVDGVLTVIFAGGNCLLEGAPGLGKTLLVRTLAQCLDLRFSRIQFTPDLMPADIIGTNIVTESQDGKREMRFQPGPVFAQIVLADEVNRATPKTQSALLEAMQEQSVTVGRTIYKLEQPFFVLATQNPIEQEGTYPLPEAQLDRFLLKLNVGYSNRSELAEVLRRTTEQTTYTATKIIDGQSLLKHRAFVRQALVAPPVLDYAVRLTLATIPNGEFASDATNKYVRYGASPRGAQALVLAAKIRGLLDGRYHASFEDVQAVALPALRHRIILNFEAEAERIDTDTVVQEILKSVPKQLEEAA